MADEQLNSKRALTNSYGATVPGSSSSNLVRSVQAGHLPARTDSQPPPIGPNQQPPIGTSYVSNIHPSMRSTAAPTVAAIPNQRSDDASISAGRNEGYSTRQLEVAAQYYPRGLPPGAPLTQQAPPTHSAATASASYVYNPTYAMAQPDSQQNLMSPSYLAPVYTQPTQHHNLYTTTANTSVSNPWADDPSASSIGIEHQLDTAASSTQPQHQRTGLRQGAVMHQRSRVDRPIVKLSLALIETYKSINVAYFEERQRRQDNTAGVASQGINSNSIVAHGSLHHKRPSNRQHPNTMQPAPVTRGSGVNNNGWDDENFDYIVIEGEMIQDRYSIEERIGKGSFGQVVRAYDTHAGSMVAIKIIKSKKPFLIQARTEIELLTLLSEKDPEGEQNIVRLLAHFIFRNHQCLVFEMLSLNLYDLLKNTQFAGVSLNLIRKFGRQILKALHFLNRSDVDIIHCDLKPENILLKHPKRSNVKVIDFGSSCKSNKRMYSYIQSRFYRSPEVILGLPYTTAIDMWSLGCILVEMYTGEPLFSGTDQFDQIQKIIKILGMIPDDMLYRARDEQRLQYFELIVHNDGSKVWTLKQREDREPVTPSVIPLQSLSDAIGPEAAKKKRESSYPTGNTPENYQLFIDLIFKMLCLRPEQRLKPQEALNHPFIADSSPGGLQLSGPNLSQSSSADEVKN